MHSPVVWINQNVRDRLKKDWDTTNPNQVERKYCVMYESTVRPDGDPEYIIVAALPARVDTATPKSIRGICPNDIVDGTVHFTDIHIHVPTSCDIDGDGNSVNCVMGGIEAWQCAPSAQDWAWLFSTNYKFALIQCSAEGITPYFKIPFWRGNKVPTSLIK